MKKNNTFISLLFAITLLATIVLRLNGPSETQAANSDLNFSSPSGKTDPNQVKENIRQRILQAIDQENPDADITQPTLQGWYGSINSLNDQTITISSGNTLRLVGTDSKTKFVQNEKPIHLEDLPINSFIIAIGAVDNNDILNAQKIILEDNQIIPSTKISALVTVLEIDSQSDTLTVISPQSTQEIILSLTKNTVLTQPDPAQTASFLELLPSEISPNDKLLVIYQPNSKNPSLLESLRIHRVVKSTLPLPSPSTNEAN